MAIVMMEKAGMADIAVNSALVSEHEVLGWSRKKIAISVDGQTQTVPVGTTLNLAGAVTGLNYGTVWYVSPAGDDNNDGLSWGSPFATIQAAVDASSPGDKIRIAQGEYDETVTLTSAHAGLELIGTGSSFSVKIAPSTAEAKALVVDAFNVTVMNIDFIGADGASCAVEVNGDQFQTFGCRYENATNGGIGLHFLPGAYAAYEAGTKGSASIARVEVNEFCWTESGIVFEGANGLDCTQNLIQNNIFRNLTTACIGEVDGNGNGSVRNVMIKGNLFENNEDGSAPTDYIDLDSAGSTGMVCDNDFACAAPASATIQLATGVLFVANRTVAGVSTGAPA